MNGNEQRRDGLRTPTNNFERFLNQQRTVQKRLSNSYQTVVDRVTNGYDYSINRYQRTKNVYWKMTEKN